MRSLELQVSAYGQERDTTCKIFYLLGLFVLHCTEQQFGNFQNGEEMQVCKAHRSDFGRFYYRFPQGEAGLDVYNRASSFISTMFRDWSRIDPEVQKDMSVIVVTHGLTLRLFLMRWYQYTVREVHGDLVFYLFLSNVHTYISVIQFEESANPGNASYVLMERTTTEDFSHLRIDAVSLARLNLADRCLTAEDRGGDVGRQRLNDIIG